MSSIQINSIGSPGGFYDAGEPKVTAEPAAPAVSAAATPTSPTPTSPTPTSPTVPPANPAEEQTKATDSGTSALDRQFEAQLRARKLLLEGGYAQIRDNLTRGVGDLDVAITDRDVTEVHDRLESFSASEYAESIKRMDQDGLLGTYLDEMTPDAKRAFFDQATRKGYLQTSAGQPASAENASSAVTPPAVPDLYRNDKNLPSPLRDTVHAENLDRQGRYGESYRAYADSYAARVAQAGSAAEIRALGPPHEAVSFAEPGVVAGHPDRQAFVSDWADGAANSVGGLNRMYDAAATRVYQLTGERPPGTYSVLARVSAEAERGPVTGSWAGGVEVDESGGYRLESESTGGIEIDGRGVTMEQSDGEIRVEPYFSPVKGVQVGPGDLEIEAGKGRSLSLSRDGEMELRYGGAWGTVNPEEGTFEVGVGVTREFAGFEVGIDVGVGYQGITAEQIGETAASRGFWSTPAELAEGTPWTDLTGAQRQTYESFPYAYSEQEWEERRAK